MWKNVKDGMLSCPRGPVARKPKMLTEREKWVLKNIAFYKSSMPTDVPDPLVNLPRDPSPDPQTSQAQSPHMTPGKPTSWRTWRWQQRRSRPQPRAVRGRLQPLRGKKRNGMVALRSTMKANQALLERLWRRGLSPSKRREAFIRLCPTPCVLPLRRSTRLPESQWQYGGGQHPQQSPSLHPLTTPSGLGTRRNQSERFWAPACGGLERIPIPSKTK
ncbi:hypothetical protein GWK47_002721 [Chionoecetes opilio]|uniref:Uncharacterized protein n=1 Tax=Chionoecetes opilio TaxID=41210 RepID=A0A8J4XKZ5_CHIOP|nr:hypothetical protein GWK47_002721 [Chionoecetes opilio]